MFGSYFKESYSFGETDMSQDAVGSDFVAGAHISYVILTKLDPAVQAMFWMVPKGPEVTTSWVLPSF